MEEKTIKQVRLLLQNLTGDKGTGSSLSATLADTIVHDCAAALSSCDNVPYPQDSHRSPDIVNRRACTEVREAEGRVVYTGVALAMDVPSRLCSYH